MINVSIDTHTVEEAKRVLINQLKSKINQDCVKAVCQEQYGIETIEGYECIDGEIVIDNDQVAFKLDFEVRFPMSMLINNGGNTATTLPEDDEVLSEFDNGLEEIEPEEINETIDEELPEIDLKD
jgi:hypothetical protein